MSDYDDVPLDPEHDYPELDDDMIPSDSEATPVTEKTYAFVYGTLKRGHHNNGWLQPDESTFIGEFETQDFYEMKSVGDHFPAVVKNKVARIKGELFEVHTEEQVDDLDQLESNGSMYERELVRLVGFKEKVWMYFWLLDDDGIMPESDRIKKSNAFEWLVD